MNTARPTVLFVPGLRDHVEDHWQTILQRRIPGARSVPPLERDKLSCVARVEALDAALARIDGPVVLVAHSAGVMITVHWAQQHQRRIQGYLTESGAIIQSGWRAALAAEGMPAAEIARYQGTFSPLI